jgi:4-amino-4-deoxy-L-arabinose transferase-like glycosyltransferase
MRAASEMRRNALPPKATHPLPGERAAVAPLLLGPLERLLGALSDSKRCERTIVGVLLAYVAAWTLYGVLAKGGQDINYDTAELIAWSREPALGYPKHPPLPTWLVWAWFEVFPLADWAFYLLAIASAALALWIAWRLSDRVLAPERRILGLAVLSLVPFYNFHALKFDHNAALLPLWAVATLCFVRSFETRSLGWAALAGVGAAAAMLGKYWSIFLLVGLGLAALVDPRRAAYFRSGAPWITAAVGAALLVPHMAWLVAHDFIPFSYAVEAHATSAATVAASVANYLAGAAGYVALPVLLVLVATRPRRPAIVDLLIPSATPVGRRLAAVAFWVPLLLPALVAPIAGLELNPIWTTSAFTLLPVVLLSSPLLAVSRPALLAVVGFAVLFPLVMAAVAPFVALARQRAGVPLVAAHGRELAQQMTREWRAVTNRPLRLVGGDPDLASVTAFYVPDRPSAFPIAEPQFAPWVDTARIRREGISLVCYMHPEGPWCVHSAVLNAVDDLLAHTPAVRRLEMRIPGAPMGVRGRPPGFIIFTVPPEQ